MQKKYSDMENKTPTPCLCGETKGYKSRNQWHYACGTVNGGGELIVSELCQLRTSLKKARETLSKLPVTADNVIIIPMQGVKVFHPLIMTTKSVHCGHSVMWVDGKWEMWGYPISECYSTLEAMQTAQEEVMAKTK